MDCYGWKDLYMFSNTIYINRTRESNLSSHMSPIIHVFIHAALLSGVSDRIRQYTDVIQSSGLSEHVAAIYVCYVGTGDLPTLDVSPEIRRALVEIRVHDQLGAYELPTLERLYRHCCHIPQKAVVLYLHTKNVGKDRNPCIEDQIVYMLYFLVERWRECVSRLGVAKTSGVDLRDEPTLHYSGNFWWATAAYIAGLPRPTDYAHTPNPLNSPRHNQEFWICSPKRRDDHHCLHDCGIDVYSRHLVRYEPHLYRTPNTDV